MRHFNRGQIQYPNVLRGCAGLWIPALGGTGSVVHDVMRGNDATFAAGMDIATDWVSKENAIGIDFDGVNDRLTSAYNEPPGSALSVLSWYRPSVITNGPSFGRWRNGTNDRSWMLHSGGFIISTDGLQNSNWEAIDSSRIVANQWNLLVGVWSAGSVARSFVNGRLAATAVTAISSLRSGTMVTTFGETESGALDFTGQIAVAGVWNRALTEAEIRVIWQMGPNGFCVSRQSRNYKSAAGFRPHWASQRTQIISGGTR